ncbi:MAG: polysaccharide pyruvyl transferase family protein [Candidatus Theseobacter exili]|nr:polysaccharide pyruvyl transferase family protein [Candidatus Theseobacter exili]
MKKIGIITLFGYFNYGNRLQMYAVQQVYKSFGFSTEIIKYRELKYKEPWLIRLKIFVKFFYSLKSNIIKFCLEKHRIHNFRKHAFGIFEESENYVDPLSIDKTFHEQYSFVSVGSDQIWGWFNYYMADFVFMKFAPIEKRITFSPSFGGSSIDAEYKAVFAEGINGINNVSVREESGRTLVKELTGKEATVLCDPTMCMTKKEWVDFSRRHKRKPDKKYILTYFLGSRPVKVNDILNKYSGTFEVVHLTSFDSPEFYAANPSEWVDYINDASLFLTDSFHGVAFAILLQTSFSIYGRVGGESMHTRIGNILNKFELEDRYELGPNHASLFEMDFSHTEKITELEKARVLDFLKTSMKIN